MVYFLRFLKFISSLVLALLIASLGLGAAYVVKWSRELPDYRELETLSRQFGAETQVYARDYTPLGILIPRIGEQAVSRTIVTLDEINPLMIAAVVSNEDRRFFEHYGLDPYGLARQFGRLARNQEVQGGSTLTNQLVKITLLLEEFNQARTPDRKVKEWILSSQVERSFTKEEILQNYLNAAYWGDGGPVELYGVYAASQAYFNTTPKDLSLGESLFLTTLIPSASRYFHYPKVREKYMRPLLERMVEDKWITRAEADAAWREKLQPNGWEVTYDENGNIVKADLVDRRKKELKSVVTSSHPHFMKQVEKELVKRFGRKKVYGAGGLRVYTTLDPKVQAAVETASKERPYGRNFFKDSKKGQGLPPGSTLAATIINPQNAEVLGMIGQKIQGDKSIPDWNNAAQGQRQIGSTIKPLLYTTAIHQGLSQAHREQDRPKRFPCPVGCPKGYYEPQNYEGKTTYRNMTIREALDRSLNLVTVRLAERVGLNNFFKKLGELGIPPNAGTGLSAALGAVETTPVNMAAAYAPFVNGGLYREPRYITRVTNAANEELYNIEKDSELPRRVWSPQVAYVGLDMIRGVVQDLDEQSGGLATRAKFGKWPVAGKTGTSNGPLDFWFIGTTPLYTGAVWVGRQQGGYMPVNFYSGHVNAPIWKRMMELAHKGKAIQQFEEPKGIFYSESPDPKFLKNVKIAMVDPRYRHTSARGEVLSNRQRYKQLREVNFNAGGDDPRTIMINIDKTTRRMATEFTLPENVVQRRVSINKLPGYAPDKSPKPLKNESPDPKAVRLIRREADQ